MGKKQPLYVKKPRAAEPDWHQSTVSPLPIMTLKETKPELNPLLKTQEPIISKAGSAITPSKPMRKTWQAKISKKMPLAIPIKTLLIGQEQSNDSGQMSPMQESEPLDPDMRSISCSRREQGSPPHEDAVIKPREQLVYAEMFETREKLIKEIQT